MNHLQEKLPTSEEAALAKISSRELSAFLETQANTQALSITGSRRPFMRLMKET